MWEKILEGKCNPYAVVKRKKWKMLIFQLISLIKIVVCPYQLEMHEAAGSWLEGYQFDDAFTAGAHWMMNASTIR